jgi:hypothetical protein
VLPVFNSREETRNHYDRIARIYDPMADHSEAPARQAGLDRRGVSEAQEAAPGRSALMSHAAN